MTSFALPEKLDVVFQIRDEVMKKWHQALHDAKVRVGILYAESEDGPAIKKGGYAVLALVGPLSLKWRVLTDLDALITIDKSQWDELEQDSQVAVLDHELSHLNVVTSLGTNIVKRDDIGRPKLKTIDGDWNGGDGFIEVIKRHGEAAIELINSRKVYGVAMAAMDEALQEQS